MRIRMFTIYKYLYIVTMTIAMFTYLACNATPWWTPLPHCFLWIFIGLIKKRDYCINDAHLCKCIKIIKFCFGVPYILFWAFTIPGWMISAADGTLTINIITRALSYTIQYLSYVFSFCATAYIFKDKLLKYTVVSMALNYTVVILASITRYGLNDFIKFGLVPFSEFTTIWSIDGNAAKALEVHDLTFAAGFIFIYFAFFKSENKKYRRVVLLFSILLMYLGYKRIQLAALVLIVGLAFLINERSRKSVKIWVLVTTIGLFIVLFSYLLLIDLDVLGELANRYGIDFMGRIQVYQYMAKFFDVSPLYIGKGMASGIKLSQAGVMSHAIVYQGHSDVVLNYIDYGFFGFSLWVWFVAYKCPQKICLIEADSAKLWTLCITYAFITYLTDNTFIYFTFQTTFMMVIFQSMYLKNRLLLKGY